MKKKILFINGHLNVGGVEKSLIDILKHLNYEKYEVDLLLLEETGDYENEIPGSVNVRLKSLKNTYGSFIPCIKKCMKEKDTFSLKMRMIMLCMRFLGQKQIKLAKNILTDNKQYDCVIGFRSGICSQIAAFAVNANKKIIWWHHGEFNVSIHEYDEMARECDAVVSVSKSCAAMLQEKVPALRSKLKVISNMIDVRQIERKCLELNPYEGNRNWITVCRISPEKHIENTIFAAKKIKDLGIRFKWHIVGDGILRESMEKLAKEQNVEDCVIFEGRKRNPYPYMKYADLYIHPSHVESQGLTILEAMSLGVPCVVTKSLGPLEFIEDGVNGIIVETTCEDLANGIISILQDVQLYDKIKTRSICPFDFLPENIMSELEELLGLG